MRWAFRKYRYWVVRPVGFHGETPDRYIVLAVSEDHAKQIGRAAAPWATQMHVSKLENV